MPRKFFRKYLPSHDSVKQNRHVARFGAFLHHPNLWHLTRHSVAGGVAIGMFSGLVPGPFQMLAAAILCVLLKVNLPVALVTTFYTNPFTIGPLYLLAYRIGRLIVGVGGGGAGGLRGVDAVPRQAPRNRPRCPRCRPGGARLPVCPRGLAHLRGICMAPA